MAASAINATAQLVANHGDSVIADASAARGVSAVRAVPWRNWRAGARGRGSGKTGQGEEADRRTWTSENPAILSSRPMDSITGTLTLEICVESGSLKDSASSRNFG
eukprot:185989-Chlamydomonas_euryale.AAC.2